MLTRLDRKMLRALYSLSNHTAWDDVDRLFEAELAETMRLLTEARDPVTIHQLQGRAKFINDFQLVVREADKRLEKLKDTGL